MKRFLYLLFFLVLLFWLEAAFQKVFGASFFIPQFVILFVTVFAISRDLKETLYWCFAAGFLGELFSGLYFGPFLFMCLIAALAAYFVTRKVTAQDISISTVLVIVLLQAVLLPLGAWFFNAAVGGLGLAVYPPFLEFFSWKLILQVLVNVIFFFPINKLFRVIFDE